MSAVWRSLGCSADAAASASRTEAIGSWWRAGRSWCWRGVFLVAVWARAERSARRRAFHLLAIDEVLKGDSLLGETFGGLRLSQVGVEVGSSAALAEHTLSRVTAHHISADQQVKRHAVKLHCSCSRKRYCGSRRMSSFLTARE